MKDYIGFNMKGKDKTIVFTKHIAYAQLKENKLTIGTDGGQNITIDSEDAKEVFDILLGVFDEVTVGKEKEDGR